MSSSVKSWLAIGVLFCAIYASWVLWRSGHAEQAKQSDSVEVTGPPVTPLVDVTLTDQNGQPFDLRALRGQVWVASFFFTNCAGPCWRLNQELSTLQHDPAAENIKFISITCDPDNDTPEALKRYAEHFKADPQRWTFLTGDFDVLKRIALSFQLGLDKATHSDRAFVVDRQGKVRGLHGFHLSDTAEMERLRLLLERVKSEAKTARRTNTSAHAG